MAKKPVLKAAPKGASNGQHQAAAAGNKLNLALVRELPASDEPVVVDVAEFGEGMTVNVRPLTVADHMLLSALIWKRGQDGAVEMKDETERSAVWLPAIAALAAVDDDGALVFGLTRAEAVQRASSLPEKYVPAVRRIAQAAIELSGLEDEKAAAAEAEKN